ncbi:MAG: HlyD family secretion protein [Bacteroidales bacterium]
MANTNKEKARKKLFITLANSFVFIVTAIAFWFIVRNYLHINDNTYVNNAQVKAYISPINSRIPGYIQEIRFIENQHVNKGDTLVILDRTDYENNVAQANAGLNQALAGKASALSSVDRVSTGENTVEASIAGVKAQLENAETDLNRYKDLLDSNVVAFQQYQQIETKVKTLQSQYDALKEQKNTARLSVTEAKSKIAVIDAQIEAAKATLEKAELNLNYTVITAPEDGVLGHRTITIGKFIQPGQQIASLVQTQSKWIEANLLERQMKLIREGDILQFTMDAMGDEVFEGKITSISPATGSEFSAIPTDNSAGNFVKVQQRVPVKIEFTANNKPEILEKVRAGMMVVITLNNKD